jgi:hypothetical protein
VVSGQKRKKKPRVACRVSRKTARVTPRVPNEARKPRTVFLDDAVEMRGGPARGHRVTPQARAHTPIAHRDEPQTNPVSLCTFCVFFSRAIRLVRPRALIPGPCDGRGRAKDAALTGATALKEAMQAILRGVGRFRGVLGAGMAPGTGRFETFGGASAQHASKPSDYPIGWTPLHQIRFSLRLFFFFGEGGSAKKSARSHKKQHHVATLAPNAASPPFDNDDE